MDDPDTAGIAADVAPKLDVLYCGVCSFPPEFCEFGGSLEKCKAWLADTHPDVFSNLYSEAKTANLTIEQKEKVEKDIEKRRVRETAKADKALQKKLSSKVLIKRVERSKRKYVTAINGLQNFDIDMKKVSKDLGKKFATGASVTKNVLGEDEIVVQGDVSGDIFDYILEKFPHIPEDNLDIKEEKTKK